jgi:TonB family protein
MSKHPTIELLETFNQALLYLLESATCLAVFYLLYHFILRKERSFKYNRFYLLAVILFSVSFPLLEISYNPDTTPTVLNSIHQVGNEATSEPIIEAKKAWSYTITAESQRPFMLWWEVIILLYFTGLVSLALRLFIQIRTFKDFVWFKRHDTRYRENYFLVNTDGSLPTFAFFNYLIWDNTQKLNADEQAQILEHEKVHINQKHSYDILFMEVLKIVFWFNPFIYLFKNLLEEIHEYEADHKVAKSSGSKAYAQLLVKLVFSKMGLDVGSYFNKNKTLKRVNMIKDSKKINVLKLLIPIPVALLLFFVFSCEAVPTGKAVEVAEIAYDYNNFGEQDVKPVPSEGLEAWKSYLQESILYPTEARKAKVEGEVVVSFVIGKSGQIGDVRLVEELGSGCDEAVLRAILNSSAWKPGVKDGKAINTRVKVPISFRMS